MTAKSFSPLTYYNEIDPYAAQWLRNLIAAGLIAAGDVDERSIADVQPADLDGYTQCHFFAGIGGWSYALRLAGWSDDKPVWTGSCPCQPFSQAGAQRGFDDARHLWPVWFRLIRECRPAVVFGEQVASALAWFDLVQADMEGEDYAVGAADLCAAGVGAPHIRQRLWFVGVVDRAGSQPRHGTAAALGHRHSPVAASGAGDVGNTTSCGRPRVGAESAHALSRQAGAWDDADWLPCRDGKARPVEPGTFPLAHGVSARVGRLRAYGNAIVPQVAALFIRNAVLSVADVANGSEAT